MAGASDKARFYLEQYVPSLQELSRHHIFTPSEISSITAKRSAFEHTINARGSTPADYARYATYEMNLEALRKKRCARLGVKGRTLQHSGQRGVFFVLERATRKFPGDMGLWMQYIEFCQREGAGKKLAKVLTNVLRLKPREWGLWVLAAKWYSERQGDMTTARSYLQRGLRFCTGERRLWGEYLRLEMVYLAKLAARRKILGLDEETEMASRTEVAEEMDGGLVVTSADIDPDVSKGIEEIDDDALRKLAAAPAFTGAIPIAIFDAAMKQFRNDAQFAEDAFDICATLDKVPSTRRILQHILDHLRTYASASGETVICEAKMTLFGIAADSEEFPAALGTSLAIIKKGQSGMEHKADGTLAHKAILMLLPYAKLRDDLDEDVVTVLNASIRRYLKQLGESGMSSTRHTATDEVAALVDRLRKQEREEDAKLIETYRDAVEGR